MNFLPIYILSLKNAQRFKPLVEALEARGLPHEIFWGIDGREGLPEVYEQDIDRVAAEARMGRPMSDGEFACALSHRLIYQRIAEGSAPAGIVLEDDAEPSEAFFSIEQTLLKPTCDLLLFDHKNTYVKRHDRLKITEGVTAYRVVLPPFLATGYMVSRELAAHLAFRNGPVTQPSDWPDVITKFNSYACNPRVITQRERTINTSGLEAGRQKQGYRRRRSLRRIFYKAYWRRWLKKRLSYKLA
jgi:glycosyl transferase family 25